MMRRFGYGDGYGFSTTSRIGSPINHNFKGLVESRNIPGMSNNQNKAEMPHYMSRPSMPNPRVRTMSGPSKPSRKKAPVMSRPNPASRVNRQQNIIDRLNSLFFGGRYRP